VRRRKKRIRNRAGEGGGDTGKEIWKSFRNIKMSMRYSK
jgi:hypothetical protein